MFKIILIVAATLAAVSAQDIPAGAVKVDANTYRLVETGSDGKPAKIFIYRRTPFGLSRIEVRPEQDTALTKGELPTGAAPMASGPTAVRVTDAGDSYKFERPDPFGTKTWSTKKDQLTDAERAVVEKAGMAAPNAAPAAAGVQTGKKKASN